MRGIYGQGTRLLFVPVRRLLRSKARAGRAWDMRDSRHLPLAGPCRSVAFESVPDPLQVADRLPSQDDGSRASLLRL